MRYQTLIGNGALGALLLATSGGVAAEENALRCRLYIADGSESAEAYVSESTEATLRMVRVGGVRVYADGSIADKQWVMTQHVRDERDSKGGCRDAEPRGYTESDRTSHEGDMSC